MSSASNTFISNLEASPIIRTDMFDDDDALLAVARVKPEDVISGDDPLALAYAQFRANVYIDQTGMLDRKFRRPDGGEHDDDDVRSLHLVGLENRGDNTAAVIAAMRLIRKGEDRSDELPIEEFFAGELDDLVIGNGSFEVSRWIARHDDKRYQLLARAAITNTGLAHAVRHDWGPCLAIVEPLVARSISRSTGGAVTEIAPPRLVEKYNDINMGIQVDLTKFAAHVGAATLGRLYITEVNQPKVFWRHSDEK